MKTYSRTVVALLVLTAMLLAMAASAQERAPAKPIKRTPAVILDTQSRVKVTPTPTPTPKIKIKVPRGIPTDIFIPKKPDEPQRPNPTNPKMPKVLGEPIKSAESLVRQRQPNAQINSTESPRFLDEYQPGAVIYQFPHADAELTPNVKVTLSYNPQLPRSSKAMPNLIGRDISQAERMLRRDFPNLVIQKESVPDRSVEPNQVARHQPAFGQPYNAGTRVILYYRPADQPQPIVTVPNVVGNRVSEGRQTLADKRLSGVLPPARSNQGNYIITAQSPAAGANVVAGSRVTLTIKPPVTVPDVTGQTEAHAKRDIAGHNLNVGSVRKVESSTRADEVLSQFPRANEVVAEGTAVNLTVAVLKQVTVPPVLTLVQSAAEQSIRDAGLVVGTISNRESQATTGTILSQTPPGGQRVNVGTPVNLVVAVPQTVIVPDLAKAKREIASQQITNAGLVIGTVRTQQSTAAPGTVLSQNPPAGQRVIVGSSVNFVVAEPVPLQPSPIQSPLPTLSPPPTQFPLPPISGEVVVPDLREKDLTAAISLLRAAGLDVGDVKKKDKNEAASFVLEQYPAAGQRVKVGTRVDVLIGKKPDGGPFPTILKVLAVAAFGFATWLAARLWKRVRENRTQSQTISILPTPDPEPPVPAPALSFRTKLNASSAEFAASTELQTNFALRFLPKADWGQQHITLTGGLIAAESEEL